MDDRVGEVGLGFAVGIFISDVWVGGGETRSTIYELRS